MYDYGARMLMPDLGRWGVMDAMSEKYARWSPYNYAINNPVMVIDPDGNDVVNLSGGGMMATGADAGPNFRMFVSMMSFNTGTSGGSGFTGLDSREFGDDDKKNPRKAGSSSGMSESESLKELVSIDGKKYHKNTTNLRAVISNRINFFLGVTMIIL